MIHQILPVMLGVLMANILTACFLYGAFKASKIGVDDKAPGEVVWAFGLPLLFLALGLLIYG